MTGEYKHELLRAFFIKRQFLVADPKAIWEKYHAKRNDNVSQMVARGEVYSDLTSLAGLSHDEFEKLKKRNLFLSPLRDEYLTGFMDGWLRRGL